MSYNDIYRMRVWGRLHGQAVCNVFHFKEVTVNPASTAVQLATDFNAQMSTTWRARGASTNGPTVEFLEVQRIVPYGDTPYLHTWTGTAVGTAPGTCYTGSIAEVVTWWTGQAGRRKRGRSYLCGAIGNDINAGQWTSTQTTRTQAWVTAFLARYAVFPLPTTWNVGVWSRAIAGPFPPYNTDAFAPIQSATIRTVIRNQRRRQIGVGK